MEKHESYASPKEGGPLVRNIPKQTFNILNKHVAPSQWTFKISQVGKKKPLVKMDAYEKCEFIYVKCSSSINRKNDYHKNV